MVQFSDNESAKEPQNAHTTVTGAAAAAADATATATTAPTDSLVR